MSQSLVDLLAGELRSLFSPVLDAAVDPLARQRLLEAVGADPEQVGGDGLVSALGALVDLAQRADQLAANPASSFAGIAAFLQASDDLHTALRGLGHASGAAYEQLGSDLIALLTGAYLRADHPRLFSIARLLGLVQPEVAPALTDGTHLVRRAYGFDRVRFDRVGPLLNDPGGALRNEYLPHDLATVADANTSADTLFPRVLDLLNDLGVAAAYGMPDEDLTLLGDAAALVDHALVIYAPTSLTGTDVEAGVALTLSSADRGDLGLVVAPFGALTLSRQVGTWQLDLGLTADVQAFAVGRHGASLLAGPGTANVAAHVAALLVREDGSGSDGPAFVLGSPTGTRLELGGAQLTASLGLSAAHTSFSASAAVSSGALVIASGDGDSLLSAILPSDGVRAEFDLGLLFSSDTGLAFKGGAGLETTLPIVLSVAGAVALEGIHLALTASESGVSTEVSAIVSARIGPVGAVLDRMGLQIATTFPAQGGNLGLADLDIHFKLPSGVGLAIDESGLVGGFLAHDDAGDQYTGMLQLEFESYQLQAFGLIATKLPTGPGYSLLAMIDAQFPPIPLGLGFMLDGAGGLLGVNRTASVDALRAAVKAHTLSGLLFPKNPLANAPQLLSELQALFPAADGRFIFGPLARITWGTPTVLTADLALVLELPSPVRLVLLGELTVLLPRPNEVLLELHMDVLGTIDFGKNEGALDAALHDSRLMRYPLHGSMALRVMWAGDRTFLLAVGGFHPRFTPPPGFPALERVGISMASGVVSKLNLDGYLAVTSNTLQFGARLDVFVGVDGYGISGFLNFDTLLQLRPFHFDADISGAVGLSVGGHELMSLHLDGALSGPAPWHVAGKVSFDVLWWTVTESFSTTFGDAELEQPVDRVDVGQLLRAALADARNVSAVVATDERGLVSLVSPDGLSGVALAEPGARLAVHQHVVPLGLTISRFGGSEPLGENRFEITALTVDGVGQPTSSVTDQFATGQFVSLSDDQELSSPSFEALPAGVEVGDDLLSFGAASSSAAAVGQPMQYATWLIDTPGGEPHELVTATDGTAHHVTLDFLQAVVATGAAGRSALQHTGTRRYAGTRQSMLRGPIEYVVASTSQLALAGVGAPQGQSFSQARAALADALAQHPERLGQLQVVARYEVPS